MSDPSAGPARALYYSRVRATLLPRYIGLTIIAVGMLFVALSMAQQRVDLLVLPIIFFPLGSFIGFMTVTVKVDLQNVVITFCDIVKRTLPRAGIAIVTTDKTAGPSGYGIRYMGPGVVGYLVGGPEVNIETNSGKTFIASTDRPDELIAVLTEVSN